MPLSSTPFCSHCNVNNSSSSSSDKLHLCRGCKVVYYCGRDHRKAHRDIHRKACNAIRRSQQVLDRKETAPNLFEEQAGHCWGLLLTRDYMQPRSSLAEALLKIKTHPAVEAAHGHFMDVLRLNRCNNMGVRDRVPFVKLRLGRDQECYDFCKWYSSTGGQCHCHCGNMSNPYLDVKNADVFESPENIFIKPFFDDLSHTVAITLLKVRLLIDVRALQNSSLIGEKVPQEILDGIRAQLVSGSAVAGNMNVMNSQDQTALIMELELQVKDLYEAVDRLNVDFWPALLDPEDNLDARPQTYSTGSVAEMQVVLQHSYDAWMETPGAVGVISDLTPDPNDW